MYWLDTWPQTLARKGGTTKEEMGMLCLFVCLCVFKYGSTVLFGCHRWWFSVGQLLREWCGCFFTFAIVSNSWSLWQCLDIWWQYNAARCDSRYILVGFLAMPMAFIDGKVRRQTDGNGIFLFSLFPHFMTWVLRLQWCLHMVGEWWCWYCDKAWWQWSGGALAELAGYGLCFWLLYIGWILGNSFWKWERWYKNDNKGCMVFFAIVCCCMPTITPKLICCCCCFYWKQHSCFVVVVVDNSQMREQ